MLNSPSSLLSLWHPLIRLFHRRHLPNHLQPLLNPGVLLQLQLSIRVLIDPWIELRIHGAKTTRQHALPTALAQLSFQYVIGPVRLRFVPCQCVIVSGGIVVPVPVQLPHHGAESTDEEELPFVEVDVVLFGWFAAGGFTSGA